MGAPASLQSSSTSSCQHTHTPITSPPPMQTTLLTPNPPQTTLLPPEPSRNKQPEFHSGLRNTDSPSQLLNPPSPYSHPIKDNPTRHHKSLLTTTPSHSKDTPASWGSPSTPTSPSAHTSTISSPASPPASTFSKLLLAPTGASKR